MIRLNEASLLAAEISRVLARIASFKKDGLLKEAIDEIGNAERTHLGLSPRFVKEVSEQDLLSLYQSGLITTNKAVALAKLLKERAEINRIENQPNHERIRRVKALTLYLEAFDRREETIFGDYFGDIDELAAALNDQPLPPPACMKLFRYYAATGKYAKAEDQLFEALESEPQPDWIDEGRRFYQELSGKSDDELRTGNLQRDELEEGLAGLRQFTPAS
jgi:hypothetical protein